MDVFVLVYYIIDDDINYFFYSVLTVDGVEIAQSMTIARYCANKYGLAGSTALDNAQMDEVVDAISDATEKQYNAYLFEKVRYFNSQNL